MPDTIPGSGGLAAYVPEVRLDAAPQCSAFLDDDAFVTGIMGPLGSGKSYTCCAKIMKYACTQEPARDGYRKTRWAVIRNTYPELRTTTIKTWLELWPEASCGPMRYSHPITHRIVRKPAANFRWVDRDARIFVGTPGIDVEVMFLAMDKADDIKHLKSLDLTGAWLNEACEVPDGVVDMLTGRVGRYPQLADVPATWAGVIMDTNATDDQNWWYDAAEKGEGIGVDLDLGIPGLDLRWQFYRQPPAVLEAEQEGDRWFICEAGFERDEVDGAQCIPSAGRHWHVNPLAENLKYLRLGYYHQQIQNKSLEWINRYMQAKYVYLVDGKPWVPEYSDQIMGQTPLNHNPELPLLGGIDAGGGTLNPAAVIGQRGTYGDWRTLFELSLFDIGIENFSQALLAEIARRWPGAKPPRFGIDPAGRGRDQIYETAVEEHLRSRGLDVQLAPSNAPSARREALAAPMSRMVVINSRPVPGFAVDPSCTMLRAGLAGKWYRKLVRTSGRDMRYEERPTKNEHSHVCDAASYMCATFGEHQHITQGRGAMSNFSAPVQMDTSFDVFGG